CQARRASARYCRRSQLIRRASSGVETMLIRILRKRSVLVAALMAIAAPALAQDAILTVEVRGQVTSLTPDALRALPPDTVRARSHDGPTQTFVGPSVATLLAHAGVQLDSLR